ncbi:SAC3/GANP/Nin1/mts3/eIF-3 p25 family-domain-containing protein [Mycena maculata]|uniref:SAC3/GANP/Nin1/mts3/eIF-3 p25 family-domain-containing protein n=1 Tax=Mycena maculata TaxID=230809 RepID=A0AAD7MZD0_9AGAR|nr:SAC3/GANP/Nin1/mts3/eIF-3 p25 family-domain-containing protein [Mycena maculata]
MSLSPGLALLTHPPPDSILSRATRRWTPQKPHRKCPTVLWDLLGSLLLVFTCPFVLLRLCLDIDSWRYWEASRARVHFGSSTTRSCTTPKHFAATLHPRIRCAALTTNKVPIRPLIPRFLPCCSNVMDWDQGTIVGTSTEIFKDYLRLMTEPKPEQIRPYAILQQTLPELKKRFRERAPYNWICSQFKSLRQDLTVQRIKNEFMVQVYEIHGRIALECGDMVEYNQCQAMLKTLYELGIPGRLEEITAYRILMLLRGRNRSELNIYVGQLTPKQKAGPAVQHALGVQRALAMGNYHALFGLYSTSPNMGAYIMDYFVARERAKALMVMTKAYESIPLSFIHQELAFDSLQQAREFLADHSAASFTVPTSPDDQKTLDCEPAGAQLAQTFETKYL